MTMMSSTSDKKSNFFFANCLQCEGIIRIPITIRPDSAVSCPHCKTQFDLVAYLDQIPEVSVSEGGSSDSGSGSGSDPDSSEFEIETDDGIAKQDGKYVVPPQIAAGMRKRRRRRRRSSSESSSESSPSSPGSSANSSSPSSSSPSSSAAQPSEAEELEKERREERARRGREKLQQQREAAALREGAASHEGARRSGRASSGSSKRPSTPARNPVMEAIKIIVGGLLAVPIAYLLLMWVFSRDPLSLRHTIHDFAPFLVPSKLIPQSDENLPLADTDDGDSSDIFLESDFDDQSDEFKTGDIFESEIKLP